MSRCEREDQGFVALKGHSRNSPPDSYADRWAKSFISSVWDNSAVRGLDSVKPLGLRSRTTNPVCQLKLGFVNAVCGN